LDQDPNILVTVTSTRNEFEGNTLVAALQARGVPAKVFGTAAATLQWEAGYSDPYKIVVRRSDEVLAKEIIAEFRAQRGGNDFSETDIDAPATTLAAGLACWACGQRLGGLPATTTHCPRCSAEIFAEGDAPAETVADGDPYASRRARWKMIRKIGLIVVGITFFLPIVLTVFLGVAMIPNSGSVVLAIVALIVFWLIFGK
jgi:hypothetical protein